MSASSEPRSELPTRSKLKVSPTSKPPEESLTGNESKAELNRKERRKEWWKKKHPSSSNSKDIKPKDSSDKSENDDSQNKPSEQVSKLRDRQTIAKPDNLQYEPNLNRGFHAKILHSLYNSPLKKKKEKDSARDRNAKNKGKRKSATATSEQPDSAKKAKTNSTTSSPPPVPQPEYFDSYAFSMNLINGEVEKVKAQQNQKGKDSKDKYVLFIGNLPHDITREQLEEHFRKTGGIKAIRIPREKGNDKGRGFAYMEFDGRISHGIALRLHQTTLSGRKINVEFTSIGGGKSVNRREKLKQKNSKRKKLKMR